MERLVAERDERMTRESGRALVEEANRWQKLYQEARDDAEESARIAAEQNEDSKLLEARVAALQEALGRIAAGAESNPASEVSAVARAALAASEASGG